MQNLCRFIEQTALKPDLTQKEVEKIVEQSVEYQFIGICLPPFWIKKAKRDLGENNIQLVSIAGFPFGYQKTEVKTKEIIQAIDDGADEIDMVWNLSAFRSEMPWVKMDIAKCCEMAHSQNRIIKIIIEACYLSDEEIKKACLLCADAGADYVKTSTGFGPAGAKVEQVRLMRSVLPSHVGVKAAGGIRDFETAMAMIDAGADRIGTSAGVSILEGSIKYKNGWNR